MDKVDKMALRIAAKIVEDLPYPDPHKPWNAKHCRLTTLSDHLREMAER